MRRLCIRATRRNGPASTDFPLFSSSRRRLSTSMSVCSVNVESSGAGSTRGPEFDTRRAPRTACRVPCGRATRAARVTLSRHQSSAARAVRCEIERGIGPIRVTAKRCSHKSKLRLKPCCSLAMIAPFGLSSTMRSKSTRTERPSWRDLEHRSGDESQPRRAHVQRVRNGAHGNVCAPSRSVAARITIAKAQRTKDQGPRDQEPRTDTDQGPSKDRPRRGDQNRTPMVNVTLRSSALSGNASVRKTLSCCTPKPDDRRNRISPLWFQTDPPSRNAPMEW